MYIACPSVLNENNIQGVLSRYWLASEIVRLIGENCPEVGSIHFTYLLFNHECVPAWEFVWVQCVTVWLQVCESCAVTCKIQY